MRIHAGESPRERLNSFASLLLLAMAIVLIRSAAQAQPAVSLTAPAANSTYPAGGSITLSASATPSGGANITNVEFLQNGSLLGQTATAPYTFSWTDVPVGAYSLQAEAFDSTGANQTSSAVAVAVLNEPPYTTDFEASEGYTLGSINGQLGWQAPQGDVEVTNALAYSGSQSVVLNPSSPVAELSQAFYPCTSSVVYVDCYAQPAAESVVGSSTIINAGGAEIGFLWNGGTAVVETFNGDGQGGGSWIPTVTNVILPLAAGTNQAAAWHRFTFREDFGAGTWDLYIDGQMAAYDLKFPTPPSSFASFSIDGDASSPTLFDTFSVVPTNPLFANESNDGISDAWKEQYGLDPTQDDRYLTPSGNGVTIIQEYTTGADPLDYFQGRAFALLSPPANPQISYSYDASGRLIEAAFGNNSVQAFTFDNASNLTLVAATAQPIVAWRVANALAADGSASGADTASPAGDNLPNLAKYAFGLPVLPAVTGSYPTIGLISSGGSSYLTLTYSRPDPAPADLTYSVQVSPDGQNWSGGNAVTTLSTVVNGSQATVSVQDNTPISSPDYGRYIRLLITRTVVSP